MPDLGTLDMKAFQQPRRRAPPPPSKTFWSPPGNRRHSSVAEPLYRLRLSILHNGRAHNKQPSQIFIYPTLDTLQTATAELNAHFNKALLISTIKPGGPTWNGRTIAEQAIAGMEDGRTEDVILGYQEVGAEESWEEFVARVKGVEGTWTSSCEGSPSGSPE